MSWCCTRQELCILATMVSSDTMLKEFQRETQVRARLYTRQTIQASLIGRSTERKSASRLPGQQRRAQADLRAVLLAVTEACIVCLPLWRCSALGVFQWDSFSKGPKSIVAQLARWPVASVHEGLFLIVVCNALLVGTSVYCCRHFAWMERFWAGGIGAFMDTAPSSTSLAQTRSLAQTWSAPENVGGALCL